MTTDTVTIYQQSEPPPAPGWRALDDSVETATLSYEVPVKAWEAYRAAEADFLRQVATIVQLVEAAPPQRKIELTRPSDEI